ncbi:MAG: Tex-like N-terminal domain-containing protein [Planctomycetia bacterium]|nr:Tex-like N-terminal domain-containing protein [Planctomycetia bacterium]
MSEPVAINVNVISQNLKIPVEHVQAVIELLEQGFPPPFIARYRRDESNNLSEEKIRRVASQYKEQQQFAQRKETILRNIAASGKLDELLEKRIREARTKKRLDDLQSPFRPQKDEAAIKARQAGLDGLVDEMLQATDSQATPESLAAKWINADQGLATADDVLKAVEPLLAERMNENIDVRNCLRDALRQYGVIKSSRVVHAAPEPEQPVEPQQPADSNVAEANAQPEPDSQAVVASTTSDTAESNEVSSQAETSSEPAAATEASPAVDKTTAKPAATPAQTRRQKEKEKKQAARKKEEDTQNRVYKDFFNASINISSCSLYTIHELNNGQRTGVLNIDIFLPPDHGLDKAVADLAPATNPCCEYLKPIATKVVDKQLLPNLKKEIYADMLQQSQELTVRNLAKNLRNLLFHKSLTGYRVLAFMPNFSRGCKLVALDEFGNVLAHDSVYITGSSERKTKAQARIRELIDKYHLSIIAIGMGTGEREAQLFFSKLIEDFYLDKDVVFVPVNGIGAEAWSSSPAAREEFPAYNSLVRETISIGRRLLNPVAELTKIDPLNMVVGLRPSDAKPKNLKDALIEVIELAVNRLGGDLNRMEDTQLRYISGLNNALAKRICEYRQQNGPFRCREDLKKVPGFNDTTYRNCIGFLRVNNGYEPLDATWIHPEYYPLAESILNKAGFTKNDLFDPQRQPLLAEKLRTFRFDDLVAEYQAGYHTIREIVQQLSHPGEENRQEFVLPIFKQVLLKPEMLIKGNEMIGKVTSIVNFGAFVDIGALNSGLVHISHMGLNYVKSPQDKVSIGQIVSVWILEYDTKRNHLSLSMLSPEAEKEEQRRAHSRNERERTATPNDTASAPTNDRGQTERRARDDRRPRRDRDRNDERKTQDESDNRGSGRIARKPETDSRGRGRDDANRGRQNRDSRNDRRQDSDSSKRRTDESNDRNRRDRNETASRMVVEPKKKNLTPISEGMKNGKEPMRSFSDLAQLFGRIQPESSDSSQQGGKKDAKNGTPEKNDKPAGDASAPLSESDAGNNDQK